MTRSRAGYQRVGALSLVPGVLRECGVEPAHVMERCGIDAKTLADPENAIPFLKAGELLEACASATGRTDFGVLLGQKAHWSSLGVMGLLMANAPSLQHALSDVVANHHRYVEGGMVYLFPMGDQVMFGYAVYQGGHVRGVTQIADVITSAAFQFVRQLSGVTPVEVLLSRSRPDDASLYERHFGVPVRFNSPATGILIRRTDLARPVFNADPALRATLSAKVDSYWAAGSPTIISRVQRAIFPVILIGSPTVAGIAAELDLHPRTLNRRLSAVGTSFRTELDKLRYELARQLLANTTLPIAEIAAALGYSAPSILTRSFRRWSGTTPIGWRTAAGAGG